VVIVTTSNGAVKTWGTTPSAGLRRP
jgi:hypothetical protein